jgi:hypothetical protein
METSRAFGHPPRCQTLLDANAAIVSGLVRVALRKEGLLELRTLSRRLRSYVERRTPVTTDATHCAGSGQALTGPVPRSAHTALGWIIGTHPASASRAPSIGRIADRANRSRQDSGSASGHDLDVRPALQQLHRSLDSRHRHGSLLGE